MNHFKKDKLRAFTINSAIFLTVVLALLLLGSTFFPIPYLEDALANFQSISLFMQRLVSLVLLVLAFHLWQRKRTAWLFTLFLLGGSLFIHFLFLRSTLINVIIFMEIYIFAALMLNHSFFCRQGKKLAPRTKILFVALLLSGAVANAFWENFRLQNRSGNSPTLLSLLQHTGKFLLGLEVTENRNNIFATFLFAYFWISLFLCLLFLLRSLSLERALSQKEKLRARELVKRYGQNPSSYLTLEKDKKLFFGELVEGVIAYGIVGDVIVVNGDPISAPEDFAYLLREFKHFYTAQAYQCVFLSTTDTFLDQYTEMGFRHVKCGEEARFDLRELTLAGGKAAKLRANINHANKAGLTSFEYKVSEKKEPQIEKLLEEVSEAWMSSKKSGQLAFTVGGTGLEDPMDRRYFYAQNSEGKIVAFNVYIPFAGMTGYMADVTRRLPDAPGGATEKLVYDAFMQFREEGCLWGSMGLAPLSNIHEEGEKDTLSAKTLEFVYNKCNAFYGFKDLRTAKEKYNPSNWVPGYFVYSTVALTPQMAYAMVKIQNPGGFGDFFLSLFKSKIHLR